MALPSATRSSIPSVSEQTRAVSTVIHSSAFVRHTLYWPSSSA